MNTKWFELYNPLMLFSRNGNAFVLSLSNTEFYNHALLFIRHERTTKGLLQVGLDVINLADE